MGRGTDKMEQRCVFYGLRGCAVEKVMTERRGEGGVRGRGKSGEEAGKRKGQRGETEKLT